MLNRMTHKNKTSIRCASIFLLGILYSSLTPANVIDPNLEMEYMRYKTTGGSLISTFKNCSINYGQFSTSNYKCLKSAESKILGETTSLYQRNKTFYDANFFLSSLYTDSKGRYSKLKAACDNTFPEPLRKHFRNQILSCKVQIDLNKYFLFANELF